MLLRNILPLHTPITHTYTYTLTCTHIVCVSLQDAYAGSDPEISPVDGWLRFQDESFIIMSMAAEFKVRGGVDNVGQRPSLQPVILSMLLLGESRTCLPENY